jgi:hypothetical protein
MAAKSIFDLMLHQEVYLNQNPKVLIFDFEKFVLKPESYLSELRKILGSNSLKMESIMKRENLPRSHINASNHRKVYKRYSSDALKTHLEHKSDYFNVMERISASTSAEHFKLMVQAAEMYESRFGLWF